MADEVDYRVFHTARLTETEQNFRNALRCLRTVRDLIAFDQVVDFGCGLGAWMAAASWLGARRVIGLDGPWVGEVIQGETIAYNQGAITVSRKDILALDLAQETLPDFCKAYDLAVSIEVAEHLPEERAEVFCQALVKASDHILFSAATIGQGRPSQRLELRPAHFSAVPIAAPIPPI